MTPETAVAITLATILTAAVAAGLAWLAGRRHGSEHALERLDRALAGRGPGAPVVLDIGRWRVSGVILRRPDNRPG